MVNTPAKLYTMLNVSAINDLVSGISPYVRDRQEAFPVVLYEVPMEQLERSSTGYTRSLADAEVTVMARSAQQAETIGEEVFTVLAAETCVVVDSISREYDQSYDGTSAGMYSVTFSIQISQGV